MWHTQHQVWANALFASGLQQSEEPAATVVRAAVAGAMHRYGSHGCAGLVATEYGDHPETAPARMRWARHAVQHSYLVGTSH